MTEEHKGKTRNRHFCKKFERKGTFLDAKKSSCCAWTQFNALNKRGILDDNVYCGMDKGEWIKFKEDERKIARSKKEMLDWPEHLRPKCCVGEPEDSFGDCDSFQWPKGPAMEEMLHLAESDTKFYEKYLKAWRIATENGWDLHELQ